MNKIVAAFAFYFLVGMTTTSPAALKVVQNGNDITVDTSGFPPAMKAAYDLMQVKCVTCHSMERIIRPVVTGVSVSGAPFGKDAVKQQSIIMLRRYDCSLSKKEIKTTNELLDYLIDEAKRP